MVRIAQRSSPGVQRTLERQHARHAGRARSSVSEPGESRGLQRRARYHHASAHHRAWRGAHPDLADDAELEVPSPTFTLAQSYELPSFALVHADLYRISDASELEEIGLSPLPEATVVLIEWPERAGDELPSTKGML